MKNNLKKPSREFAYLLFANTGLKMGLFGKKRQHLTKWLTLVREPRGFPIS